MPKVLLYEPGESGHRPVILRYLENGLPAHGWNPVVLRDKRYQRMTDGDLRAIENEALAAGCDLVHLLTIDGCAKNWMLPRREGRAGLPVVGSYYLFNNLWGARGAAWLWAIQMGYIDHILISDPFLDERFLLPGLREHLGYVPDPWCQAEFPKWEQADARLQLQLPASEPLVLVFGVISLRKGVDRILKALRRVSNFKAKVVFAGKVLEDAAPLIADALTDPLLAQRIIVRDGIIAEEHVSKYFYAADYVLSDYPLSFKVSSGVFTRALAAGRPPIFPNHGVNARMIKKLNFGVTYTSESVASLADALVGVDAKLAFDVNSEDMCSAKRSCATSAVRGFGAESYLRTSSIFVANVAFAYHSAMCSSKLIGFEV